MTVSGTLWKLLPRPVRETPADLVAVVGAVVATNVAVFAPIVRETAVRIPLGLAFVLFVPGYALVAALFPEAGESAGPDSTSDAAEDHERSRTVSPPTAIGGPERAVLSLGSSVAIVSLAGLALNYTPWGVRLGPVLLAVSGAALGATAIAAARRRELSPRNRFRVPYRRWAAASRTALRSPDSRADGALNVLLVVTVLFAVGGVGYALATPSGGERFSEVAVLTEDDGELVAGNYPSTIGLNESREFVFEIDNDERRSVDYTVVVAQQNLDGDGNETVVEQRELTRFEAQFDHGQTWRYSHNITPAATGDTTRFVWLVYLDGDVPADPSLENADYSTHLWIDVDDETASSA